MTLQDQQRRATWEAWNALVARWCDGDPRAREDGWKSVEERVTKILSPYSGSVSWSQDAHAEWIGDEVLRWQSWADRRVSRQLDVTIWTVDFRRWVRSAAARANKKWNHSECVCAIAELGPEGLEALDFARWLRRCEETDPDEVVQLIATHIKNPTYRQWLTWNVVYEMTCQEISLQANPPMNPATIRSGVMRARQVLAAVPEVRACLEGW
ncbi:MAG: hypothetical protein KGJ62_14995 [Armatimonadetes bacterium]|nr:hypothetical protein [Armatimonadota bacterium]MDE2206156.1 hypothetical protein [Armatimonadota bacterium]